MILNNENKVLIGKLIKTEMENTWVHLNETTPVCSIEDSLLTINNGVNIVTIDYTIECFLRTLSIYKYIPLWYLEQILKQNCLENTWINTLISMNLIYAENLTNGIYIRPTFNLIKMFGIKDTKYVNIRYNMMSHDISKFDIYFNILNGTQEFINTILKTKEKQIILPNTFTKNSSLLDNFEDMGEGDKKYCNSCIDESNIKISSTNINEITRIDNVIIEQLKNGNLYTEELSNPKGFYVYYDDGNDSMIQFPDLIVPLKRGDDGSPNSIAIEVEITAKAQSHYDKNVLKYKNNLKYGSVIWFVDDPKTSSRILKSYNEIGGTGFTNTYIINYTTPRESMMEKINE